MVHVDKALNKDLKNRFSLPILPASISKINGAMAQPFGMAEQLALLESGERVPKLQLPKDLSLFSLTA
jgi:hypothetical protein